MADRRDGGFGRDEQRDERKRREADWHGEQRHGSGGGAARNDGKRQAFSKGIFSYLKSEATTSSQQKAEEKCRTSVSLGGGGMTAAQRIAMEAAAFHQQQKQQQAAEDDEGAKVAVEGGLDAFLADADEEAFEIRTDVPVAETVPVTRAVEHWLTCGCFWKIAATETTGMPSFTALKACSMSPPM